MMTAEITNGSSMPYWLANVPRADWPSECPGFLKDISEKQQRVLSTPDDQYQRMSWDDVKRVVKENKLDRFDRLPSELRRYIKFTQEIKLRHGSIMDFVLKERLKWQSMRAAGPPFADDGDITILQNDWPYGIDGDIVHLVVWTKFELAEDAATGDISHEARQQVDDYVEKTFRAQMPREQVVWFKNWRSLKSVEAVEHFHVMLYKPRKDLVDALTHGDVPLAEKIKRQR